MADTRVIMDALEDKENIKNCRKAFRTLQSTADRDKENLIGRLYLDTDCKLAAQEQYDHKQKKSQEKSCQTTVDLIAEITAEDLTSAEPSENYWKLLALKNEERLAQSLQEKEKLKRVVESLQEENRLCKAMLKDSQALVEVLEEMLGDHSDLSDAA